MSDNGTTSTDAATIDIDPKRLTLDELEELEELTGQTTAAIFSGDGFSAKAMKAVVFMFRRRIDPTFTLEDAGRVNLVEINVVGTTADPTAAAG